MTSKRRPVLQRIVFSVVGLVVCCLDQLTEVISIRAVTGISSFLVDQEAYALGHVSVLSE